MKRQDKQTENKASIFVPIHYTDHPLTHTPTYTLERKENTLSTAQNSKVKNSSSQECGKRENHCTSLKLERKIQAKKVAEEREAGWEV